MKYKNYNKGFTLIELLVVIAIIGLLSSIVLSSLASAREKAQDSKSIQQVQQLKIELELYALNNGGQYPQAATVLNNKQFANKDDQSGFLSKIFSNLGIKTAYAASNPDCIRSMTGSGWTNKLRGMDNGPVDRCIYYYHDDATNIAAIYTKQITDKDQITNGNTYINRNYGVVLNVRSNQDLMDMCDTTTANANGNTASIFPVFAGATCVGVIFDRIPGVQSGGSFGSSQTLTDADSDGYYAEVDDCNDSDPNINPGQGNCTLTDADSDGYYAEVDDCNDSDPNVNPGQGNCTFTDADSDGYYAEVDDCNDSDPNVNPGLMNCNMSCSGTPTISCDGQDYNACTSTGYNNICTWGGATSYSCSGSYDVSNDCHNFDSDETNCTSTSGCAWDGSVSTCNGNYTTSGDCSTITDELACASYNSQSMCAGYIASQSDSCYSNGNSCGSLNDTQCSEVSGCTYQ